MIKEKIDNHVSKHGNAKGFALLVVEDDDLRVRAAQKTTLEKQ